MKNRKCFGSGRDKKWSFFQAEMIPSNQKYTSIFSSIIDRWDTFKWSLLCFLFHHAAIHQNQFYHIHKNNTQFVIPVLLTYLRRTVGVKLGRNNKACNQLVSVSTNQVSIMKDFTPTSALYFKMLISLTMIGDINWWQQMAHHEAVIHKQHVCPL